MRAHGWGAQTVHSYKTAKMKKSVTRSSTPQERFAPLLPSSSVFQFFACSLYRVHKPQSIMSGPARFWGMLFVDRMYLQQFLSSFLVSFCYQQLCSWNLERNILKNLSMISISHRFVKFCCMDACSLASGSHLTDHSSQAVLGVDARDESARSVVQVTVNGQSFPIWYVTVLWLAICANLIGSSALCV